MKTCSACNGEGYIVDKDGDLEDCKYCETLGIVPIRQE